uniref:Uncharacterized protein n=1 Tax=Anguilla anguilla TaxID=7936 RepID=A0A0E9SBW9_ANGAN
MKYSILVQANNSLCIDMKCCLPFCVSLYKATVYLLQFVKFGKQCFRVGRTLPLCED